MMRTSTITQSFSVALILACCLVTTADEPTVDDVRQTIGRAAKFARDHVARHGGYVYQTSADLKLREAEGIPDFDTVWVQPPGTPAVGEALLRAYQATGDKDCWQAAHQAAHCLTRGQLQSGGWYYSISFEPAAREKALYRRTPKGELVTDPTPLADRATDQGWDDWKRRKHKGNITTYDDDTTQAATRFLIRMDAVHKFQDAEIHDAAVYSLRAMLTAQYPSGGWSSSWDRFPDRSPDEAEFPIKQATLPASVSQKWPKDFTGCYVLNDNQMSNCIDTLLLAWETYQENQYLTAAKRAGEFLIRAQLPAPQPAWAQQYDAQMQPCWCRAFEPPAVSGGESQKIILSLLALYEATKDRKFLAPIPPALDYLEKSELPGDKLARFYELRTNRPIYFQRGPGGQGHEWTYSDDNIATGYGYIVDSNVASLRSKYEAVLQGNPLSPASGVPSEKRVREIIRAMDERGAWAEKGTIRDATGKKVEPPGGILRSETFIKNLDILSRFVAGRQSREKS